MWAPASIPVTRAGDLKDICEITYWSEQVTGHVSFHQEDTWQMKDRLLRASESRHLRACTLRLRHTHSQRTCGKEINLQTGTALQQPEPEEIQIHRRLGRPAVFWGSVGLSHLQRTLNPCTQYQDKAEWVYPRVGSQLQLLSQCTSIP